MWGSICRKSINIINHLYCNSSYRKIVNIIDNYEMFYLCMGISMLLYYVLSVDLIIWHVSYSKPYGLLGFTKRNVCIYVCMYVLSIKPTRYYCTSLSWQRHNTRYPVLHVVSKYFYWRFRWWHNRQFTTQSCCEVCCSWGSSHNAVKSQPSVDFIDGTSSLLRVIG